MNKILIVDDEPYILELLKINLEATNYLVKTLTSGEYLIDTCLEFQPEIILLDIMLPGIDGLELCKIIKSHPTLNKTGIILISAKGEIDDKVYGLDLGADDYIAKPFSVKEILSRVNALLRRVNLTCKIDNNVYFHRELKFDFNNKIVYKNEIPLDLTHKELKLLELLISNADKVVSRELILNKIWSKEESTKIGRSLDVYIRKLRLKLDDGSFNSYIETVHGRGYKLV